MIKNKDKVKQFAGAVKGALGGALRGLGQGLGKMNKPLGDAVFALGTYLSGWTDLAFLKDIVANTLFSFRDALGGVESPLGKVAGLLGILLRGTADADVVFAEIGRTLRKAFEEFDFGAFLNGLSQAVTNAPALGEKIVDLLSIGAGAVGKWAKEQIDKLREGLAKKLGVEATWDEIGGALIERIIFTAQLLGMWAQRVIQGIRTRLAEKLGVEPTWGEITGALIDKMLPALAGLMEFGKKMAERARAAISYGLTQSSDASWGEIAQVLVEKMLKGAVDVTSWLADVTAKIKEAVSSEAAQKNLEEAGRKTAEALRDFIGGLFADEKTGRNLLSKLAEGLGRATVNIGDTAKAIAVPFVKGFIEELAGKEMSAGVSQALDTALGAGIGMINPLYAASQLLPSAKEFSDAWLGMNDLKDMPWYTITNDLSSHLGDTLPITEEEAARIGAAIPTGMTRGFLARWQDFSQALTKSNADAIKSTKEQFQIKSPSQVFFEIGKQVMEGLKGGILAKAGEIAAAAAAVVRAAIAAAKAAGQIASPSKAFMYIGEMLAEGLAKGLSNKQKKVLDNLKKLMNWTGVIQSVAKDMADYIEDVQLGGLQEQLKDIDAEIESLSKRFLRTAAQQNRLNQLQAQRAKLAVQIEKTENAIAAIQERQQTLDFLQAQVELLQLIADNKLKAKDILGGLELGINADAKGIMDAMIRALDMLIQKTHEQLGISSPSKVFMGIGEQLMRGLTHGIYRGALDPIVASSRVTGAMQAASQQTTINRKDTIIIRDRAAEVAFAQSRRETALRRLAMGAM